MAGASHEGRRDGRERVGGREVHAVGHGGAIGEPAGDEERPAGVVHDLAERDGELGARARWEGLLAQDHAAGAAAQRRGDDVTERSAARLGRVGEHEQAVERRHSSGRPSHVVDASA